MGVFTHVNSPLKKASSMYDMQAGPPRNSFAMAAQEIREERERSRSPAKRQSEANLRPASRGGLLGSGADERRISAPGGALKQRPNGFDSPYRRGPSRF